jgi:soluble lytic murein transglycosylase-like protein
MNAVLSLSAGASEAPTLSRVFELARGVFAWIGFAVAFALAVPQTRDGILNQFQAVAWRPMAPVAMAALADAAETGGPAAAAHALDFGQNDARKVSFSQIDEARTQPAVAHADANRDTARAALTQYIANRYRVADEVVAGIVAAAYGAAADNALDPLVVLAVAATESGYNPIAESVVGAKGLMQVIAKFHPEKLAPQGGEVALFEPEVNIRVGAQILHEYLRRYGDLETALQAYAGALDDADTRYARKVLAERDRLKQVVDRSQHQA